MKIEIKPEQEKDFWDDLPKLVIHDDGTICLAISRKDNFFTGFCLITTDKEHHIGEFSQTWDEMQFKPFTGQITLSNGE